MVGGYSAAPSTLTLSTNNTATYAGTLGGTTTTQNSLNFALSGSGYLTLSGSNSYTGTTAVNGGVLIAGGPSAFGVNSALTVSSGATAVLAGNSLTLGSLAGSGIVANASATPVLLTLGADNTNTQFTGTLQDGTGGGSLSLLKTGSGTWSLGGTHTYSGPTTVAAGALQLLGGASVASGITVNAGAGLGLLNTAAPTTANLNTLTFGAAASDATVLNVSLLGGWSATTPLLVASGAVTTNGTTTINLSAVGLPAIGLYPLLDYGSLGGSGSFALGSLPSPRMAAHLVNNTATDSLELDVTAVDASKWTGAHGSTWDVSTTANWKLVSAGSATTYLQGDNVQFDDTGVNTAINLPGTVTPSNVQFSNNNLAYSISGLGKISGNTALILSGSGRVALNTNNDYTGGTYVNGGTLQLGSGGTTGSIAGSVANNALLVFNRSDSPTFSGVISGPGAVTQSGSGMLTLVGNDTYTGLTTVSTGTLQLGGGGSTGSLAGNILNNSTVVFNRADAPVYAGSISGNGSLVQQGAGTTILTGNSTYSGGTVINNGALQVGNGGAVGSITGAVLNNGTLIFSRSDNPVFAGTINGSGSLVQQGAGNLILTGNSSFTGGTSISSGTLQLGNGGSSGSIVGDVSIGSMLSINQSGNVLLAGTLTGPGGVSQIGSGVTTLSGTNAYYAGTTVTGGFVAISSNQNLGSGALVLNGGGLQITADIGSSNNMTAVSGSELKTAIQVGPNGATIDTGSHWLTTLGQVTGVVSGGLGATLNKIGSGTWYVGYGMGSSSFNGNVNIQAGTLVDTAMGLNGDTDAFGNYTTVTVAAGATWDDSWGNGEALGGIAGAGTILETNTASMSFNSPVSTTFSGQLLAGLNGVVQSGGTMGITQAGGGSITLTNTANNYPGVTTVTNGAIIVSANVAPNQTGPLGNAASAVLVGDTAGNNNARLLINTPGVRFSRDIQLQSGNAGISTIGGTNTSGTVYYEGNIILGLATTAATAAMPLTVTAASGGTVEIDGPIVDGSGVTGTADSLTMDGPGTLILTNSNNSYQGGLDVEIGTVVLATAGALPAGSPLTVGAGGTFVFDPSVVQSGSGGGGSSTDVVGTSAVAVPEPSTFILLAVGTAVVAFRVRWRRKIA